MFTNELESVQTAFENGLGLAEGSLSIKTMTHMGQAYLLMVDKAAAASDFKESLDFLNGENDTDGSKTHLLRMTTEQGAEFSAQSSQYVQVSTVYGKKA